MIMIGKSAGAGIGLCLALIPLVVAGAPQSGASAAPPTRYYLALGDSLSTGGGADPGHSYVDDIYSQLSTHNPGLVLKNLAVLVIDHQDDSRWAVQELHDRGPAWGR